MSITKSVLISTGASAATEALVWWLCSMFHRGEWDTAGCILVYLHLPGYWIADTFKQLPLPGIAFLIFICFIGFVQWLLIYFVGLTIWSKIRNHEKTAA